MKEEEKNKNIKQSPKRMRIRNPRQMFPRKGTFRSIIGLVDFRGRSFRENSAWTTKDSRVSNSSRFTIVLSSSRSEQRTERNVRFPVRAKISRCIVFGRAAFPFSLLWKTAEFRTSSSHSLTDDEARVSTIARKHDRRRTRATDGK